MLATMKPNIADTPRSPTTSASCTSTGHGVTSPAGDHRNTLGKLREVSTPAAKATGKPASKRWRNPAVTAMPIPQFSPWAIDRNT